jgi:hypothetical protein
VQTGAQQGEGDRFGNVSESRFETDPRSNYHPRVGIVNNYGDTLRHVPGATARAMVEAGIAMVVPTRGRVREVVLAQPASTHAQRIGPPSAQSFGAVRFHRWVRLEQSAARIVEHHPRALYV